MAKFREFYFTFNTCEDCNFIEGTIEDFLDWTFDTDEDDESLTKEEKLELLDDLIADIEAYKQKI